jgi:hypothetical protein
MREKENNRQHKRNVFLFTKGDHHLIDEFSPVIGIDSQNRDLLLEQCSRSRGGEAAQPQCALRTRASDPLSLRSWKGVGFDIPR